MTSSCDRDVLGSLSIPVVYKFVTHCPGTCHCTMVPSRLEDSLLNKLVASFSSRGVGLSNASSLAIVPAVSPPANIGFNMRSGQMDQMGMMMGHNMRSGQMDQMGMMMGNMGRMMHMVTNLVGGQLKPVKDEDCRANVFTSPRKAERSTSAGSSGSLQDSQTAGQTEAVVRQAEDQISATLGDLDSSEEDSKGKKGKKGRKAIKAMKAMKVMKAMKAMKAKAPAVVKAPKVFKRPDAKTKETAQVVKSGVLSIGLEITRSNWQGDLPGETAPFVGAPVALPKKGRSRRSLSVLASDPLQKEFVASLPERCAFAALLG